LTRFVLSRLVDVVHLLRGHVGIRVIDEPFLLARVWSCFPATPTYQGHWDQQYQQHKEFAHPQSPFLSIQRQYFRLKSR